MIDSKQKNSKNITKNFTKNIIKKKIILSSKRYCLIKIDANNTMKKKPVNSDTILDNFDYQTAIQYDRRSFWRLFFICLLAKESIMNIILFHTPLDLRSLRICNLIFSLSCDLAFNTLFYTNQKISEKYHYKGKDLFLFSLINNIVISVFSSLSGLVMVNILQQMIDARSCFEDLFRNEEKKMIKNDNYKVSKERKKIIVNKIMDMFLKIKIKIIIFIILEFSTMLFFYYFVTAFCEVYTKTQKSWLSDCLSSFLISFVCEIITALLITIFYILSIRYKIKFVYKLVLFIYNL